MKRPHLISLLICIYCLLNASDLAETWLISGRDSLGACALALWCSPVIAFWRRRKILPGEVEERPLLLGLALTCSFLGLVVCLRVLGHLGLALAIGSLLPSLLFHPVWLLSSLSWMPAFSWLGGRLFPGHVAEARIVLAALPAWYFVRAIGRLPWRTA